MELIRACTNILEQLQEVVRRIEPDHYSRPIETLSMSTIGQHIRHTLEFFLCLESGFESGIINYDKRPHDKLIETGKIPALNAMHSISLFIRDQSYDKALRLEVGYDLAKEEFITIQTNFSRELVYNIEHAVHHMALIKIGLKEVASYVPLPTDFGIAASTIRYKESVGSAG